MKRRDFRWLIVFGCNLLLLWLAGLANFYLAGWQVSIYAGGLLVAYAALRLDLRHGFASTCLTALAADALAPVPFGTSLALFGLAHAVVFSVRQRFPREETALALVVALVVNLFLFLALSFALVGRSPDPGAAWLRLLADLAVSQVAVALATPWFMALQTRALALARLQPESGRPLAP